jgi:hypothetical protein
MAVGRNDESAGKRAARGGPPNCMFGIHQGRELKTRSGSKYSAGRVAARGGDLQVMTLRDSWALD